MYLHEILSEAVTYLVPPSFNTEILENVCCVVVVSNLLKRYTEHVIVFVLFFPSYDLQPLT